MRRTLITSSKNHGNPEPRLLNGNFLKLKVHGAVTIITVVEAADLALLDKIDGLVPFSARIGILRNFDF